MTLRDQFADVDYMKAAIKELIISKLFTYDDIISEHVFKNLMKDITDYGAYKQGRVTRSKMYNGHKSTISYTTRLKFNDTTRITIIVSAGYGGLSYITTPPPELNSLAINITYEKDIFNSPGFSISTKHGRSVVDANTVDVRELVSTSLSRVFIAESRRYIETLVDHHLDSSNKTLEALKAAIG